MALVEINFNPDKKQLRVFGFAGLVAALAVSAVFYYFKDVEAKYCLVILGVGAVIFMISRLSLKVTKLIYVTMCMMMMPIGLVMNFIVFFLFFFLLMTPLGLLFKLCGRDILERRHQPEAQTYWTAHKQRSRIKSYFNQF